MQGSKCGIADSLENKIVVIGVSGGIAAYKTCTLVSALKKLNAGVRVAMTKNAAEFVTPLTFETLSGSRVAVNQFDRNFDFDVAHISWAKAADIFVVAPATADIIAKLANGICDDFLTTTFLACNAKKIIAPAMNSAMLLSPVTKANIEKLAGLGCEIVYGDEGRLACGDTGAGRMAEPEVLLERIKSALLKKRDYLGKKALITAGATIEDIDRVRCLTNYSSGKMGIALARAAYVRGADVTLVLGRVEASVDFPAKVINVKSTREMYDAVLSSYEKNDIIIKAAAPSDYRPKSIAANKLKANELTLELVKNPDIAAEVGKRKGERVLVIFCAETENLVKNAKAKLKAKNADMVVANDITLKGAGFNSDTNIVTIITNHSMSDIPRTPKDTLSDIILDKIMELP